MVFESVGNAGTGALTAEEQRFDRWRRTVSFFLGPLAFVFLWLWPFEDLTPAAHRLAAILAWVLVYWVGEAIPIPVTALLGPVLCILLGVGEPAAVFAPFANPIIFLFLGSFLLAEAMVVHRVNERIALTVLSTRWLLRKGYRLSLAIGAIPFLISMWISDSATTAMMYPVLLGILSTLRISHEESVDGRFQTGLLLSIAYSALIGGTATPVGTPPNLIGVGLIETLGGTKILFLQWMLLAIPIALVLQTAMFFWMRIRFRGVRTDAEQIGAFVDRNRHALGPMSRGEKNSLIAFFTAVVLWIFPGVVASLAGTDSPLFKACERHIPEGVASLVAALLLFLLPTDWKARKFTLTWKEAVRIDWGTILLFGGGLSLGSLMFSTGLAEALGNGVIAVSGATSLWALTACAIGLAIVLTEMTSNTATASMLVPVFIALAKAMGVSVIPPAVGVCLGASMAFMLPVSTPSNAIIYGSGRVPITAMITTGAVLDVISFFVIFAGLRILCPALGLL
jgi:sodium-dependent dicarboxylate transporter 2/3/5